MLQTTLVNSLLLPVVEYEINTTSENTWWDALLGMDREMKAHVNFQFKWDVSIVLNFDSSLTIQYIIRAKPDAENVLFTLLRIVPQLELIALWNIFTYEYLGETKKTLSFFG